MSDNANAIGLNPLLAGLQSKAQLATAKSTATEKSTFGGSKVGQDEFLRMLVTQLKNQDPLDPMKNEQFAVDLAQFSQLERLISIDDKLGNINPGTDSTSFASYLGNEVVLNSDKVQVKNGDGGFAHFQLVSPAANARVELLNSSGEVVRTIETGALDAGRQRVPLTDLDIANGEYQLRVNVLSTTGGQSTVDASAQGVITGFIPGADPTLLMGDREVKVSDIKMISVAR